MATRNKQVNLDDIELNSADKDVAAALRSYLPRFVMVAGLVQAIAASAAQVIAYNAASFWNVVSSVTGNAQGNWQEFEVALAPGTYAMKTYYSNGPASGIIKILVDGAQVDTVDAYAAALAPNQVKSTAGIVVAKGGHIRVRFLSDTKNASASTYTVLLHGFTLTRTGA